MGNGIDIFRCKNVSWWQQKRTCSRVADSARDDPVKRPLREGMDCAPAAPGLTTSELDAILVPSRVTVDSNVRDDANVEDNPRYAGVGYCASAVVAIVCIARDVARKRRLTIKRFYWDNVDVMDYVRHDA